MAAEGNRTVRDWLGTCMHVCQTVNLAVKLKADDSFIVQSQFNYDANETLVFRFIVHKSLNHYFK